MIYLSSSYTLLSFQWQCHPWGWEGAGGETPVRMKGEKVGGHQQTEAGLIVS